jgi:hypothetical protein
MRKLIVATAVALAAAPAAEAGHVRHHARHAWGNPIYVPAHNWGVFRDDPVDHPDPPDYPQGNPPAGTPDPWTLPGDTVIGDEGDYWTNVQHPGTGGWIWVPIHFGVNFDLIPLAYDDAPADPAPSYEPSGDPADPCLTAPFLDGCYGGS